MSLCFIEPQNAIRVIADSVGREARRQILGEVVRAWVDEIPEAELESHYAKAVADLDEHDLSLLAAWHVSLEVGHPLPSKEFLVNVFPSLGENRREAFSRMMVKVDPHSPGRFRTDGAVQNFDAFGKAFQCKQGAPMFPTNNCRVW